MDDRNRGLWGLAPAGCLPLWGREGVTLAIPSKDAGGMISHENDPTLPLSSLRIIDGATGARRLGGARPVEHGRLCHVGDFHGIIQTGTPGLFQDQPICPARARRGARATPGGGGDAHHVDDIFMLPV